VKDGKKVLFIGHDASRTGAPLLLLHFLKWLRQERRFEFEVLLQKGGDLADEYRQVAPTRILQGEVLPPLPSSLRARIRRRLIPPDSLRQRLDRLYPIETFPVVYSNTITNGRLIREFSRHGRTIICHAHEMRMAIVRWGGSEAIESAGMVDCFVAGSEAVKRDLCEIMRVPAEKIKVVHDFGQPANLKNGQQRESRKRIRAQLGIEDTEIASGMCGTTDWRKGADLLPLLAKTVSLLAPQGGHKFIWIGSSPDSLEYQQIAHDVRFLGLNDSVRFIHKVNNPHDYLSALSALDLFTLTSREDPFPLVMLEAASLGLPVLCFEGSGGGSEFVGDDAGLVVPYLDVGSMAKAVVSLGSDPDRRRVMGENARAKTHSKFSLTSQAPKLLAFIEHQMSLSRPATKPLKSDPSSSVSRSSA
jgi:glycosyltransferase involved in cell wall biosynthesis